MGVRGDLAAAMIYNDEVDYIQQKLIPILSQNDAQGLFTAPEIQTFWTLWLQNGGWWRQNPGLEAGSPQDGLESALALPAPPEEDGPLRLVTFEPLFGDGQGANRPWLQETPDPMTTVTWGSWIEVNPHTAEELGISDDDIVTVSSPAGEIEAVVYVYPAIRPDTVAMPFGQGHTVLGRFAEQRGSNPAYILGASGQNGQVYLDLTRVTITPTGRRRPLARLESREGVYGEH
jgi:anaerobic selenocysteine-containing dehydrogenase